MHLFSTVFNNLGQSLIIFSYSKHIQHFIISFVLLLFFCLSFSNFFYKVWKTLAILVVDAVLYKDWLIVGGVQDSERLRGAVLGLKVFWHHLDLKRRQLEQERRGRRDRLSQLMQKVELDIRDLIYLTKKQVPAQVFLSYFAWL